MSPLEDASDLVRLAELVAVRNDWEYETAAIIQRPALIGNLGEYIAARIFDIQLHERRNNAGSDGIFLSGPLAGQTVNIKWYSRQEGILDLAPGYPDYYLVLAGPHGSVPSGDHSRPWLIESVYVFSSARLIEQLTHVKLGVATSIRRELWIDAEIYPTPASPDYALEEYQRELLGLFSAGSY